jgi:threonine aldolase
MEIVDLRSDTVTKPTSEMREAMAKAEVGDDVYREDPTVNRLQEISAAKMGKEAGLFITSGTMGNLLAVMAHCQRGEEALMGDQGHTFVYEAGGISALGGVFAHTLPNQADGSLKLEDIRHGIRPDDIHQPPTRLLILENTQNRCGGVILTKEYTHSAAELVHQKGLKLHIDGARIFNAAIAQNLPASELVADADSVTFCLSKGLCAPVGSVLCGTQEFIEKARRLRKMLGGAMRQAGILAAAGLVALDKMVDRLAEDHRHAMQLAQGLQAINGIEFLGGFPQTNMVFPSLGDQITIPADEVVRQLSAQGVKVSLMGERRIRLVTHAWIDDAGVEKTISAFKKVLN